MVKGLSLSRTLPIIIGIVLLIVPYAAYVFVIPPLYTPKSGTIEQSVGTKNIVAQNETILWPLNKTVSGTKTTVRPDLNFTLKLTIKSLTTNAIVNMTVYAADVAIYQFSLSNQTSLNVTSLSLNETFSRFPGVWRLGLEIPFEHGYDVYVKLVNVGNVTARISYTFSGSVGYAESLIVNFAMFVFGGIILVGSVVHTLWVANQRRLEEKVREAAEREASTESQQPSQ